MQIFSKEIERRTVTDQVFENLHAEIVSSKLLPGSKLSEAEVAGRFGVSRQPVRDAFNRLCNLDLLLIRPQKATVVRGFSIERILQARFLRLAVEIEVIRNACKIWDEKCTARLRDNIDQQQAAVDADHWDKFHTLDFQFHELICELSGCHLAIDTIKSCRQKTDRLCVLSFDREREVEAVLEDHNSLINALANRDENTASDIIRLHVGRLDSVVEEIRLEHPGYFE